LKYTNHTKSIAFAEELIIMIKAESIREAENIANVELRKILTWPVNNKIRFYEHKSKVMLMTRRNREGRKEIEIYLNNKPLIQVHSMKFLGIIFDSKLTLREHINYMAEKCTKLIFALFKSAKLNWELKHAALKTIYTGGILPLLLYGAPVWRNVIDKASYKSKLVRVQRLINIKIAKAYRTVSNDALCILTGLTPIAIKMQETSKLYQLTKGNRREEVLVDRYMGVKYWHHPADKIIFLTKSNEAAGSIQIFTDGSKSKQGVGEGIAIFRSGSHFKSLQYRLNKRWTNNQAEQLAILRALEYIENIQTEDKKATMYTNSQITLDSLKNNTNHTFLIEEIRKRLAEMGTTNWTVQFYWVKAHVGIQGNELPDTLAEEAATNADLIESYKKVPKSVVMSE